MADMHQEKSTCVQLQWLYTAFASFSGNLEKLICSKLPKMLLSLTINVIIDGKPSPNMENYTYIRKMQSIASLTVLV